MRQKLLLAFCLAALPGVLTVQAQEHGHMEHHAHRESQGSMAMPAPDGRQPVEFPAEMRQHTLANMRDHLQALSEILTAMSAGEYAQAARVADQRLGMDSPSAEGCRAEEGGAPMMSRPAGMDHQMARYMPEGMRTIGLEMHKSASAFADAARKIGKKGDPKPAVAALSRVTRQCAACHSSYRLY